MPSIPFSDRKLKALPLPERRKGASVVQVDYWDDSLHGFGLRVSSSGAKTWMVMARVRGEGKQRQMRYTIGRFKGEKSAAGMSLAEARFEATKTLRMIQSDVDPRELAVTEAASRAEARSNTFASVRAEFHTRYAAKHLRATTAKQYAMTLARAELRTWEHKPLGTISKKDVHRVIDDIADTAPIAANRSLAVLRKFMNWAVERGYISTSPTAGVKAPEKERIRERHLFGDVGTGRPSELALAWQAFGGAGVCAPYFRLLLLTGQRRMEVAAMTWSELHDLDGPEPRWVIPAARAKNNREHIVPLCPLAVSVIRSVTPIAACPFLFSSNGVTCISGFSKSKQLVDNEILRLVAAAPGEYNGQFVEPWVVHDLRRSHFTGLLELGLSADVVDALQNHISGASRHGVRKNYNHATYAAAKRSAVGIWNAHVSKLLNIQ